MIVNDWLIKLALGEVQPAALSPEDTGLPGEVVPPKSLWQPIEEILTAEYDNPDLQAAKIICACVAAHRIVAYPPAWLMLIAAPGSMKTDLLEGLRGLPRIHFVDEVTQSTFISGKVDEGKRKRTRPASYLHRIGDDGILVASDFSTITSTDPKALGKILSQLRKIYDGNYSREFGTDENLEERSWKGRLTLLAGATPTIDAHYAIFHSLGERFVRVRCPRAGGIEAGIAAMGHTNELSPRLQQAMQDFLLPILTQPAITPPAIAEDIVRRIASLTEFIALARTVVPRARYNHEISGAAFTEGNTRLPQQLAQIARGWALLGGRNSVCEEDLALVRRAAFDCLPPTKRKIIERLLAEESPHDSGQARTVVSRAVEDLEIAGIVEKSEQSTHRLTKQANQLLTHAGVSSPNFHCKDEKTPMSANLGEPDPEKDNPCAAIQI